MTRFTIAVIFLACGLAFMVPVMVVVVRRSSLIDNHLTWLMFPGAILVADAARLVHAWWLLAGVWLGAGMLAYALSLSWWRRRHRACPACLGSGRQPWPFGEGCLPQSPCERCGGAGKVKF